MPFWQPHWKRVWRCCACGAIRQVKSQGICPNCQKLVEPDRAGGEPVNPEKEVLIPIYIERAKLGLPLFQALHG
jgi:hypothetical protein